MSPRSETHGPTVILAAARRRFLQWGYSGTSVSALAQDLGMTKAALYYHFVDKEALFLAVVQDYLTEVQRELAMLPQLFEAEDGEAALGALALVFLGRHETSGQMQQLSLQESRHLSPEGQSSLSTSYHESMVRPVSVLLERATKRGWIRGPREGEPATIWVFLGLMTAFLKPGHGGGHVGNTSLRAFVGLFIATLKGDSAC